MGKLKTTIFKYFIEMLIVAFGVFLGIYVSDWKTNKNLAENTSRSLSFIITELESNKERIGKSIEYHERIKENYYDLSERLDKDELQKAYFNNKTFHFTRIKDWTGVGLPKFETIAFEGAKINGVFQELDIELTQLIAGAYKQIEFNQDFGQKLFNKMIAMDSSTKAIDAVGMIELLISDILRSEQALNEKLEQILTMLKEKK